MKRTPAKKVTSKPLAKVTYATCEIFSTMGMTCPLCQAEVPPNTAHSCSKPE